MHQNDEKSMPKMRPLLQNLQKQEDRLRFLQESLDNQQQQLYEQQRELMQQKNEFEQQKINQQQLPVNEATIMHSNNVSTVAIPSAYTILPAVTINGTSKMYPMHELNGTHRPSSRLFTSATADSATMQSLRESLGDRLCTNNSALREFLAELFATAFFVMIGLSANIQAASSPTGNSTSAHLAWGFGFAFAVLAASSISGAHLNPAISFSALVSGKLSIWRFILYTVAQLIGAFVGAALAFVGHLDDIGKLDGENRSRSTAALFATFPAQHISVGGSIADQLIGTAILAGTLALLTDRRNRLAPTMVAPLAGLLMAMIAMTYGANGGFAINPARDLGPRLFVLCVGYGTDVFSANNYYFWIPLAIPFVGAPLGVWLYKLFIGAHGLNEKLTITELTNNGGGAGHHHHQPQHHDDRGYKVGPKP